MFGVDIIFQFCKDVFVVVVQRLVSGMAILNMENPGEYLAAINYPDEVPPPPPVHI